MALTCLGRRTVAGIKLKGSQSATLVQNDMSLLETPTAIAFRWHKLRCAWDVEANNRGTMYPLALSDQIMGIKLPRGMCRDLL